MNTSTTRSYTALPAEIDAISSALEQVQSLFGALAAQHLPSPYYPAFGAVSALLSQVEADLLALNKAIESWASDHSEGGGRNNPMDIGHITSLAEMAANTAQVIIDTADNGFIVEAQA